MGNMLNSNSVDTRASDDGLCKTCSTKGCVFQHGIKRIKCDFYTSGPERKTGHWICESQWSDTMGTYWNTWKCDQCNCVATKGWEHTESGMKPKGKFCSECGSIVSEKVIYVNITEKE